jgi:hypothetical protein
MLLINESKKLIRNQSLYNEMNHKMEIRGSWTYQEDLAVIKLFIKFPHPSITATSEEKNRKN